MKKMAVVFFVYAVGLFLIFNSAAQAHSGTTWYWGTGLAESKIENTIQAANALNADDVWRADCVGVGKWIYKTGTRVKLFKHFECFIQYTDYDGQDWEWERVLHVLGAHRFALASV